MNPLISIMILVYNTEAYLSRCLHSVLEQTYTNLEIILIDDGSTDSSGIICDQYAREDPRIKVIHQENGGCGHARNTALRHGTGKYLMWVDSDDWMELDAVESLYARISADKTDVAVGKHAVVFDNGKQNTKFCSWMTDCILSQHQLYESLGTTRRIPLVLWGKLFDKDLFNEITFPTDRHAEDRYVLPFILEKCNKISIVNKTILYYYQRSTSLVHTKGKKQYLDTIHADLRLASFLYKHGVPSSSRSWYKLCIQTALHTGNHTDAFPFFLQYFNSSERKDLIKGQGFKLRLQWLCLKYPFLYTVIQFTKKLSNNTYINMESYFE